MLRLPMFLVSLALFGCTSSSPTVPPQNIRIQAPSLPGQGGVSPNNVSAQGSFQPNANLFACTRSFSNRPETNRDGQVLNYSPLAEINGIVLAVAPVNDACMTSGFGPRNGRRHKGIDLQIKPTGTVFSAAPGIILELEYSRSFGNQLVIEHGNGVFTRYAHLASFNRNLKVGDAVGFGVAIGLMGDTGNASAVHLHYEVLTGNYNTPKKSFGLVALDPLSLPGWRGMR